MSNRYYISDHHFGHENIRQFEPDARPFDTHEEMAEWLIAKHNSRIEKRDVVVFGGDVGVGKNARDALAEYLPRMNGTLELILGNHDELSLDFYLRFFKKVTMYQRKTFEDERVWFTHVPIHDSELEYRTKWNIHGHLHSKTLPDSRYINMCVEHCNAVPQTLPELMGRRT